MENVSQYLTFIPVLFAVQIFAVWIAARHAGRAGLLVQPGWIFALLWLIVLWGGVTTYFAATGIYLSPGFLASYPTFWLPFIPVMIVMLPFMMFGRARKAIRQLIDATPATGLIGVHMMRVFAVGTLIKTWQGEFSKAFQTWVGLPDLAFGLSAVLMFWLAQKGRVNRLGLFLWSMAGVLVIVPSAPFVAQRELPGVLFVAEQVPPMTTIYEFPMALAPSLVVPFFVMLNMFVAIRQIERLATGQRGVLA